jgi:hypothetical protein
MNTFSSLRDQDKFKVIKGVHIEKPDQIKFKVIKGVHIEKHDQDKFKGIKGFDIEKHLKWSIGPDSKVDLEAIPIQGYG